MEKPEGGEKGRGGMGSGAVSWGYAPSNLHMFHLTVYDNMPDN